MSVHRIPITPQQAANIREHANTLAVAQRIHDAVVESVCLSALSPDQVARIAMANVTDGALECVLLDDPPPPESHENSQQ